MLLARLRGLAVLIYASLTMGLFFLASLPAMLVTGSGDLAMWLARRLWSPSCLWVSGCRRLASPMPALPAGPFIFASNHESALDIWVLVERLPRNVRFIAKEELFRIPIFGWYMRLGGHVPVDRRDHARAVASLARAAVRVRNGTSLIVFPEGTRSRDGRIHAFKKGPFAIAAQSGVPVVPVAITGAGAVTPKDLLHVYPGPVRVTFGTPVRAADFPGRDELLREVRRQIIAMDRAAGGPGGADEPAVASRGFEGDVGDAADGR
jgi:1-acyl-sn-glycerol-3-phosphate acyltransferase